MTPAEFDKKFWPAVRLKMPSLREWLVKLSDMDDNPKQAVSSLALLDHWKEILADVDYRDAFDVFYEMTLGAIEFGKTNHDREHFASTIRREAKRRAFDREQTREKANRDERPRGNFPRVNLWSLVGKSPEEIDKAFGGRLRDRAYKCKDCLDRLVVDVWHPRTLELFHRNPDATKGRSGFYTCVASCTCPAAYDRNESIKQKLAVYAPERFCLVDTRRPLNHEDNIQTALAWIEVTIERRKREDEERLETQRPF